MKNYLKGSGIVLVVTIALFMLIQPVVLRAQGTLTKEKIQAALDEAYTKFKDVKEGKNADYIKELANVDPNIFGIALVTADGQVYTKGDISSKVSIQSVSKVFTMAQVIEEQGHQAVQDKIGVDATGEVFNSISCR